MQNQINLKELKLVLKKSTTDFTLYYSQLKFQNGRITSQMVSTQQDLCTMIDIPNEVITFAEQHDAEEVILNFDVPKLLKTINTIEKCTGQNIVDMKIEARHGARCLTLHPTHEYKDKTYIQCHTCFLLPEGVIVPFVLSKSRLPGPTYYAEIEIDSDLLNLFRQIKLLGSYYGKVYVRVIDGTLSFDTTDENNRNEDDHLIPVLEGVNNIDDHVICFDYKKFTNLISLMKTELSKENPKQFKMEFSKVNDSAIIYISSEDKSEQYFLFNRPL